MWYKRQAIAWELFQRGRGRSLSGRCRPTPTPVSLAFYQWRNSTVAQLALCELWAS
jgi:hypothetical protein